MIPPFDIFYKDDEGHLLWCDTAGTLEDAKVKAKAMTRSGQRREIVIFSQKTGNRLEIKAESQEDLTDESS
jgi:hypothetical protein